MFTQTMTFPATSSHSVFIDATHQYFYISSAKIKNTLSETRQPVVVRFDEVMAYSSQIVGQKTVTKKKGSLGRAVVGGALFGVAGAVIGAGTAKQETKSTGGISTIRIDACVNGLNTEFLLARSYNAILKIFGRNHRLTTSPICCANRISSQYLGQDYNQDTGTCPPDKL